MLALIGMLILIGAVLWAVGYAPFLDINIKRILYIVIVLLTVVYLLNYFGIMPALPRAR